MKNEYISNSIDDSELLFISTSDYIDLTTTTNNNKETNRERILDANLNHSKKVTYNNGVKNNQKHLFLPLLFFILVFINL
jgi:hypothetical protein